jgi:hypothetical protein
MWPPFLLDYEGISDSCPLLMMDELIGGKSIFSIRLQSHTKFNSPCLFQSLSPNPGMSPFPNKKLPLLQV